MLEKGLENRRVLRKLRGFRENALLQNTILIL